MRPERHSVTHSCLSPEHGPILYAARPTPVLMKRFWFYLLVIVPILAFAIHSEAGETEVRVYKLRYREGAEAVRHFQPFLSPLGAISYYAPSHSIVVNDIPRVHERIRTELSNFDVALRRYQIEMYDLPDRVLAQFSRDVRWQAAGGGWGVGFFGPEVNEPSLRLRIARWTGTAQSQGGRTFKAVGFEGRAADLWTGPVSGAHEGKVRDYVRRSASGLQGDNLGRLETGFSWRVTDPENPVIEFKPRIFYQAVDATGILDVPGREARFHFPPGQWFVLSVGGKGSEVLTLLYGSGSAGEGFNLLVRVSPDG